MIELKADPTNRKAEFHINNTVVLTERGIRQGFYHVGKLLKASASAAILAKDKTGVIRRIRRGKVIRRHQASASGESFANLSGAARRQLGYDVKGSTELEFGFRNNSETDEYTERLENPKKLNRPALGNAVKKEQGNTISTMESELRKALK